jgi:hypothetical protein
VDDVLLHWLDEKLARDGAHEIVFVLRRHHHQIVVCFIWKCLIGMVHLL